MKEVISKLNEDSSSIDTVDDPTASLVQVGLFSNWD